MNVGPAQYVDLVQIVLLAFKSTVTLVPYPYITDTVPVQPYLTIGVFHVVIQITWTCMRKPCVSLLAANLRGGLGGGGGGGGL